MNTTSNCVILYKFSLIDSREFPLNRMTFNDLRAKQSVLIHQRRWARRKTHTAKHGYCHPLFSVRSHPQIALPKTSMKWRLSKCWGTCYCRSGGSLDLQKRKGELVLFLCTCSLNVLVKFAISSGILLNLLPLRLSFVSVTLVAEDTFRVRIIKLSLLPAGLIQIAYLKRHSFKFSVRHIESLYTLPAWRKQTRCLGMDCSKCPRKQLERGGERTD